MKLRFYILLSLVMGFLSTADASVTVNLYSEVAHGSTAIAATHETGSSVEVDLKNSHLGCDKISLEKSIVSKARVDHIFLEQNAAVNSVIASSINDFSQFVAKNEGSEKKVMIDFNIAGCVVSKMRVRIL